MHDRQWLQSGAGHDRSFYEVCRGRAITASAEETCDHLIVDRKTWLSDDVSIG